MAAGAALLFSTTACIQQYEPQSGTVTADQAASAIGAFDNFVNGLTANLCQPTFSSTLNPNDFGVSSFFLQRDVMGQDIVTVGNNWFSTWSQCGVTLAPIYLNCQFPWTFYYSQIMNCNQVLKLAGETPDAAKKTGVGIAHAMRAWWYFELAQMFAQKTYTADKEAITVPLITEKLVLSEATNNPRVSNEVMFKFILEDLAKAAEYLKDYKRADKTTPDMSVVNGLYARVYLVMGDWANAEKYAKLAQAGYTALTPEQYTDRNKGFNDMNYGNSWMMATQFKPTDICITYNDGDSSWGTWMICEFPSGEQTSLGYLNAYGGANLIDRHLYETIPATDCRKKCFLPFTLDEMDWDKQQPQMIEILKEYSDVPENLLGTGFAQNQFGGIPLKFRSKDGNHETNQVGYCVAVPMMRVEEMMLIEAEAAGRQDEARGKALLEAFGKLRDPNYTYGSHNEAYGNSSTSPFVNEVWWQRRAELWGEGFATLDIKRLQKGIIRSYPGTNHEAGYRWNTQAPPQWMNYCIVQTETNYNKAIVNNPTPIAPEGDSPEVQF